VIEELVALVGKVPPEAWEAVGRLLTAVVGHDDPARAAERAAAAIASEAAADEAIRKSLEARG
jgi:hypothetical protein